MEGSCQHPAAKKNKTVGFTSPALHPQPPPKGQASSHRTRSSQSDGWTGSLTSHRNVLAISSGNAGQPGFSLFYMVEAERPLAGAGALEGKCFHLGTWGGEAAWAWLTFLQPQELSSC